MLSIVEPNTPLIENLNHISERLIRPDDPAWFKELRQKSLTRFKKVGIPTIKDEDWKYTNLSKIAQTPYHFMETVNLKHQEELKKYLSKDEISLTFVNGILNQELSSFNQLPEGLTIIDLHQAVEHHSQGITDLLKKYDPKHESAFVSLNHALVSEGVFIHCKAKTHVPTLIHILHVTESQKDAITAPRAFIILEPSSEITVLESHLAFENTSQYLSIPVTDVHVGENATLHYCKAQNESLKAAHIGITRVWQERDSQFDGFSLMKGGALTRNNLDIVVNGEGASSHLNGFYGVNHEQLVDNHSSVDHRVPNCTSNQLYKGILNGKSHAVFNGKIFVRPIAQQTNSYQLNKNLILGQDCRVDTKPQLEIFADDVKCTHGATIGQLNEDEVFYLQARAIPKKTAIRLLARGYVDDAITKVTHPEILRKLNILLEPVFTAL